MNSYVLVCQQCGAQREIPEKPIDPPEVWLRCVKLDCKSNSFALRLRIPLTKSEPHP